MILDTFLFNDELDLLELRLRELDGVVDHFYAIQGSETFAGAPKVPSLNIMDVRWLPWAGRLHSVEAPRFPGAPTRWARENAARDAVVPVLADYADSDLILHEDADEIPSRAAVEAWRFSVYGDAWVGFRPKLYYYYLNLRWPYPWSGISLSTLGTFRRVGPNGLRNARKTPPILTPKNIGGWHFSWLGGVEAAQKKIASWPHEEYDNPRDNNPERIAAFMAQKRDPFGRRTAVFHEVPITDLPQDVQSRPEVYAHLLLSEKVAA
jgi:beta-1,4-mannosyl-glycoprotein beta-1,4-N-acetylglucosaminyltransferase